jgi:hypothetical protein
VGIFPTDVKDENVSKNSQFESTIKNPEPVIVFNQVITLIHLQYESRDRLEEGK